MSNIELLKSKIIEPDHLDRLLSLWRFKNETVVFTNGCFDVIHFGHIKYLGEAANLGTKLIIGVNTDASVKRLKGNDRPINEEEARVMVLAAFSFVDAIVLFDDDTPFNLINRVKPNILVKGGDYRPEDIVGYNIVTKNNGKVITIGFVDGFSSTSIIKKSSLA